MPDLALVLNPDLLKITELHQDLNKPVVCDFSKWRETKYILGERACRRLGIVAPRQVELTQYLESFSNIERYIHDVNVGIRRSEVLEMGRQFRFGKFSARDLFLASMIWGNGGTGYGRYRTAIALTVARNGVSPLDVLETVGVLIQKGDLQSAYETMANALWRIGPAFGTKFLYFASEPELNALIFDGVVAGWKSSDLPWIVNKTTAWTWDWGLYDNYRTWCSSQFEKLLSSGCLTNMASFRHDNSICPDFVEASIFTYETSQLKRR
jgi:hypothetical protein